MSLTCFLSSILYDNWSDLFLSFFLCVCNVLFPLDGFSISFVSCISEGKTCLGMVFSTFILLGVQIHSWIYKMFLLHQVWGVWPLFNQKIFSLHSFWNSISLCPLLWNSNFMLELLIFPHMFLSYCSLFFIFYFFFI